MSWLAWAKILLFMLPCLVGMTGAGHHAQPLVEIVFCEFFAWASLEPQCSMSPPP
jgi:hypothetical protein